MDTLLYFPARGLIVLLQALPLELVARIGRAGGALAYRLDGRHRRVALKNLTMCFGEEKSPAEIRAIARENFRRIGENFACAVKTASMSQDRLRGHMEIIGAEKLLNPGSTKPREPQFLPSAISAISNYSRTQRPWLRRIKARRLTARWVSRRSTDCC